MAAFSEGMEAARRAGLEECNGCGLWREAWMFGIDIPGMMLRLKEMGRRKQGEAVG